MSEETPRKDEQDGNEKAESSHDLIMDYSDSKKETQAHTLKDKATDKMLISGVAILLLLFAALFGYFYWKNHQRPLTMEEMHALNLQGKLDSAIGFVYNDAYSFIKQDDFWYTALTSQSGRTMYNFAFRYSPLEVEGIPVTGTLNQELFNNAREYYITFTPTSKNLTPTVVAVNDYNQQMLNVFHKTPIPSCDRNETAPCWSRPIITCDNVNTTKDIVVYIQESNDPQVEFKNNCIMLKGNGFDQVKAVDRVLYHFYTIMS
jgi:hypothetical protein